MLTVSHEYLYHLASSFNATAKRTLKGLIWSATSSLRAENTHNVKYNYTSFDEPPITVSKFLNLAVHWS